MKVVLRILDNVESYVCRSLLAFVVVILFIQILSRETFQYSFSWIEELSTYLFVWFAYFGASYAAKLGAHNRVTFQFRAMPRRIVNLIEGFADLFWLGFNLYFVYLSYDFVANKMNLFWTSQTLGVPMKYFYWVLPIAFTLMSIRILQVNYYRLFKGVDVRDPDDVKVEQVIKDAKSGAS